MKAGNTEYEVGTHIKIVESDEKDLIGMTGKLTHPFGGLMAPNIKYIAGVYLDKKGVFVREKGVFIGDICNLTKEDKFIVLDDEKEG